MSDYQSYQAWVYVINDCGSGSDSGCDSADEFVPVGNLVPLTLILPGNSKDEDLDCSDSVSEDESGVGSSSDEGAGRSSPDGSSQRAGSDEAHSSGCFLCRKELSSDKEMGSHELDPSDCFVSSSTEKLLTDEEMELIVVDPLECFFCRKELVTDEKIQSSSIDSSANGDDSTRKQQRMMYRFVRDQTTAPHCDQQRNKHMSPVTISWKNTRFVLVDVRPVAMGQEDE